MKKRYLFLILVVILGLVFILGPRPDYPGFDDKLPKLKASLTELDALLAHREQAVPMLKPNNHSRIVWADSVQKTPYSVVYLHGFSASPMEGDPIHFEFARRYGCNLYLPRLAGHGLADSNSFLNLTPKDLIESAKEALVIGQLLGDKVILMSTSTGGTLSAWLAAQHPKKVHAQIMYAPNIDLYDGLSEVLTMPWGEQIAKSIQGDYRGIPSGSEADQYWTTTYRTEGLIALKTLIEATMTDETFKVIKQPIFAGYYYKNDEECDHTVSVPAIRDFMSKVSTPADQKMEVAFTDVKAHVICSRMQSQDLESVRKETFQFAEQILGLQPI